MCAGLPRPLHLTAGRAGLLPTYALRKPVQYKFSGRKSYHKYEHVDCYKSTLSQNNTKCSVNQVTAVNAGRNCPNDQKPLALTGPSGTQTLLFPKRLKLSAGLESRYWPFQIPSRRPCQLLVSFCSRSRRPIRLWKILLVRVSTRATPARNPKEPKVNKYPGWAERSITRILRVRPISVPCTLLLPKRHECPFLAKYTLKRTQGTRKALFSNCTRCTQGLKGPLFATLPGANGRTMSPTNQRKAKTVPIDDGLPWTISPRISNGFR